MEDAYFQAQDVWRAAVIGRGKWATIAVVTASWLLREDIHVAVRRICPPLIFTMKRVAEPWLLKRCIACPGGQVRELPITARHQTGDRNEYRKVS